MIKLNMQTALACLVSLAVSGNIMARTASPTLYATEETRDIVGGRKVLVLMPESIHGSYTKGELEAVAFLFGGMLLESLTEKGIRNQLSRIADQKVAPLRAALAGFEFQQPMQALLTPTIESSKWVRGQDLEFTRDGTPKNIEQELNDSNTRQMLAVNANYYTDVKFRSLVVSVESSIYIRKIPKGEYSEVRLRSDYVPFRQLLRSIVYLPGSDRTTPAENLARWSADNGKLARQALEIGMQRAGTLFSQNLDATKESAAVWSKRGKRKSVTELHLFGWVVERRPDTLLFFSPRDDALNYIEELKP